MSTAKSYAPFPTYPANLAAIGAVTDFWTKAAHNAADVSLWWAQKWFEAPALLAAAWTPPVAAAVVDYAETAAERTAAIVEHAAEEAVATAETVHEETAAALPEPDDLTRLVGVGPKLAVALAGRGVTSFSQVAAWTEEDLADLDKALDLKGRAVRDAWVAQARRIAAAD